MPKGRPKKDAAQGGEAPLAAKPNDKGGKQNQKAKQISPTEIEGGKAQSVAVTEASTSQLAGKSTWAD